MHIFANRAQVINFASGNQFRELAEKATLKNQPEFFLRVPWEVNGGKCKEMF